MSQQPVIDSNHLKAFVQTIPSKWSKGIVVKYVVLWTVCFCKTVELRQNVCLKLF